MGKHQLLLEAFQEHLGAHHFEGQPAIWVRGAGLNSQLHHKLPPCLLSKTMQVPGVPAHRCLMAFPGEEQQRSCVRPPQITYRGTQVLEQSLRNAQPALCLPRWITLLPCHIDSGLLVGAGTCSYTPLPPTGPLKTSALEILNFPLAQTTLALLGIMLATFFDRPAQFMVHIWWSPLQRNKAPLLWKDLPSERKEEKGTQRD